MLDGQTANETVFVLGTGTIISLLTAAVVYLRQIAQEMKRIADSLKTENPHV